MVRLQHSQFLIFGPAAAFLSFSPALAQLYMPIAGLILLGMISAAINLIRPDWVRFHWLVRILRRAGRLVLCYLLVRTDNPIVIANIGKVPDAGRVVQIVNQTVYYGILFTAVISVIHLVKDIRRVIASEPAGAPAPGQPTPLTVPIRANFSVPKQEVGARGRSPAPHLFPAICRVLNPLPNPLLLALRSFRLLVSQIALRAFCAILLPVISSEAA